MRHSCYDDNSFQPRDDHILDVPSSAKANQVSRFADAKALGSTTGWALISAIAHTSKIDFIQNISLSTLV